MSLILARSQLNKNTKKEDILPLNDELKQIICDYILNNDFDPMEYVDFLKIINYTKKSIDLSYHPMKIQEIRLDLINIGSNHLITGLNISEIKNIGYDNLSYASQSFIYFGIPLYFILFHYSVLYKIFYTNNHLEFILKYGFFCTSMSYFIVFVIFFRMKNKNAEILYLKKNLIHNIMFCIYLIPCIEIIIALLKLKVINPIVNEKMKYNNNNSLNEEIYIDSIIWILNVLFLYLIACIVTFITLCGSLIVCLIGGTIDTGNNCSLFSALYYSYKIICGKSLGRLYDVQYLKLSGYVEDLQVLRDCTSLKKLDLSGCRNNLRSTSGVDKIYDLRELIIDGCINLQLEDIMFLHKCHKLSKLSFKRSLNIPVLMGKLNDSLVELNLDYSIGLKKICGLKSNTLEYLSVRGCINLTTIKELQGLQNLQTIDMSYCSELININTLKDCHTLNEINLEACVSLTDIKNLASLKLKKLNLNYCHKLKQLDTIITDLENLREKIDINFCIVTLNGINYVPEIPL